MKKLLTALGIILVVLGILGILLGLFTFFIATQTMDATPAHYRSQYQFAAFCFIAGAILLIAGIICLRAKKKMSV